jgi:hypothetical protein
MSNADPIKLKKKFPTLGLGDIQSLIDQFRYFKQVIVLTLY